MWNFLFFNVLDFKNVEIFGVRLVKRVKMRHCAKFRGDRSNRCWDMAIFRNFKMAAANRFSKSGYFRGRKGAECQSASAFHISWRSVTLLRYYGDFSIIRSSPGDDLVDWNSRVSVRPYVHKKFFPFWFNLVCGRPWPGRMHTSVTSTRSKVKVTELPKLRKLHFSTSIPSAVDLDYSLSEPYFCISL